MGACGSKPEVLEGTAPEKSDVAGEDMKNKEEGIDVANNYKRNSLNNLFKESEEGKGSEQVKEETSQITQVSKPQPEEIEKAIVSHITAEIEEVVSKTHTPQTQTFLDKTTEEIKSETETPKAEEVIKSETETPKADDKSGTETPMEKEVKETIEITQAEKKIEGNSETNSEAPMEKKTEEKTVTEAKKPVIEERDQENFGGTSKLTITDMI